MADLTPDSGSQQFWRLFAQFAPGFMGSIVATYYFARPATRLEALLAVFAGTCTSVFVAPYAVTLIAADNPHAATGIGFGVGWFTIILMPPLTIKLKELITAIDWAQIKEWLSWKKTP